MSIFGDYFDDDYFDEEHRDEYMYSVTLSQVSDLFSLTDTEFEWHSNNRQWIFKNNYTYKFSTDTRLVATIPNSSCIRKYTYYFKDKNAAMLFGLWCPERM